MEMKRFLELQQRILSEALTACLNVTTAEVIFRLWRIGQAAVTIRASIPNILQ